MKQHAHGIELPIHEIEHWEECKIHDMLGSIQDNATDPTKASQNSIVAQRSLLTVKNSDLH